MKTSDRTRIYEVLFVILTGIGKFIFMDGLDWRFFYIATACIGWISYISYRARQNPNWLRYWGLSGKHFKKTFLELFPIAILSITAFWLVGNYLGTNVLNLNILPILLIYPIWGIIQQFIIVGLIARNLEDYQSRNFSRTSIIILTALIFAIVHYPFLLLVVGTFFLALLYTYLYLNQRNLIVLGLYHGWIGAFFFYTILARDPWEEVFGMLG